MNGLKSREIKNFLLYSDRGVAETMKIFNADIDLAGLTTPIRQKRKQKTTRTVKKLYASSFRYLALREMVYTTNVY